MIKKKRERKKRKAINVMHLGVGPIDYLKGLTGPANTGPNKTGICVRYAFPSRGGSLVMTTKGARKRAPHAFLCGVYDWHKS